MVFGEISHVFFGLLWTVDIGLKKGFFIGEIQRTAT